MHNENPYHPPVTQAVQADRATTGRFYPSLLPAILAIGVTFVLWVAFLLALHRFVPASLGIPLWSLTLILATAFSVLLVRLFWRSTTHPIAFAVVFALFAILYLVAEGDVSNGSNYSIMSIVYGTMLVVPFVAYFVARLEARIP